MANGFDHVAGAGFALGADHGRAFTDTAQSFAKITRSADERNAEIVLPDVIFFVGGRQDFAFVDEVDFERLQDFGFGKVSDAHLCHHGNRDSPHDFANHLDGGHAGHAAFLANVGGNAFESHDGASPGLLRDFCLLGIGDVHDDAAFQHFGEADFHAPFVGCGAVSAAVYFLGVHVALLQIGSRIFKTSAGQMIVTRETVGLKPGATLKPPTRRLQAALLLRTGRGPATCHQRREFPRCGNGCGLFLLLANLRR